MSDNSHSNIGRYEIKQKLGEGAMAEVVQAYDPWFKRDVAVKILHQRYSLDATVRQRFILEAQSIGSLDHPAIVPIYDAGQDEDKTFIVMRYMEGGSLYERIQSGRLTFEEISTIVRRIGSALDTAHAQGIIHRDVKPENILFDKYGEAYLADFGIVKLTNTESRMTLDTIIGTPQYMSPEQVEGYENIDGRSDLYSLGAVLFEMLTGHPPYQDDTAMKIAMQHVTRPVPKLNSTASRFPTKIQKIIDKSMAKSREDRFTTGLEFADNFETALTKQTGFFERATPINSIPAEQSLRNRFLILAPIALITIGLGAFFIFRGSEPDQIENSINTTSPPAVIAAVSEATNVTGSNLSATSTPIATLQSEIDELVEPSPTIPIPTISIPIFSEGEVGFVVSDNEEVALIKEQEFITASEEYSVLEIDSENSSELDEYATFFLLAGSEIAIDFVSYSRMGISALSGSEFFVYPGRYSNEGEIELEFGENVTFESNGCFAIDFSDDSLRASCFSGECALNYIDGNGNSVSESIEIGNVVTLDNANRLTASLIPFESGNAYFQLSRDNPNAKQEVNSCFSDYIQETNIFVNNEQTNDLVVTLTSPPSTPTKTKIPTRVQVTPTSQRLSSTPTVNRQGTETVLQRTTDAADAQKTVVAIQTRDAWATASVQAANATRDAWNATSTVAANLTQVAGTRSAQMTAEAWNANLTATANAIPTATPFPSATPFPTAAPQPTNPPTAQPQPTSAPQPTQQPTSAPLPTRTPRPNPTEPPTRTPRP